MNKLYWNTVTDNLKEVLFLLIKAPVFNSFRLVGGTALSLQRGHRLSIDIDLFTDAEYGSIDFNTIHLFLKNNFSYFETTLQIPVGLGKSYFIGSDELSAVKLDLFYTDTFIQNSIDIGGVRMASIEEIIAMKIDVIQREGRKKDFWDIHEFMTTYSFTKMINLHKQRYPYNHDKYLIITNLINCSSADNDFNPNCLKGKLWPFIKQDLIEYARQINGI